MLRVVQWATGAVGKAAIEAVRSHPDLELAGCYVHSVEKSGRDVGEILGVDPLGVTASNDVDAVLAIDADAVIYAPLVADTDELARILRSGKNVVTPVGWFYPGGGDTDLVRACLDGGVTLHGIGLSPGGVFELLPLVFSAMSSAVTFVRAENTSDIRTYNAPDVVRFVMGFGGTPEQARTSPMLGMLNGVYTQSVRMCLDGLGFADAQIHSTHTVSAATAPIDSPIGLIEAGQVAAQRFQWDAFVGDRAVVRVATSWLMGEQNLEAGWGFGPHGPHYEIEVKGDPDVSVIINGWHPPDVAEGLKRNPGVVATAVHCVNSVPYVCAAEPGIKSCLDLPVVSGRAHPDLARPRA